MPSIGCWRRPAGALVVLLCTGVLPLRAQDDDRAQIMAVIQRMLDGMRTRDTALMRSAFHPTGRLVGMRARPDGSQAVQILTAEQFAAFIARDQRPTWIERLFDPEVRIEGTMATVWAAYDFHFAQQFSHCGVDAFQLLKTAEGWRIMSIADTYQTAGCPRRPPPAL